MTYTACVITKKSFKKKHHQTVLFKKRQENKTARLWTYSGGKDKESRKAVPVPDQKGEEEGGTKLQPPGETTEKRGE